MNTTSRLGLALLATAGFLPFAAAQQLVLPDNVYLGAVNSTATAWRATDGRFQLAYDSSHFTNAGVTGPVQLTRLRFRARDGEPSLAGPVYTGVTVEVGTCAVNYASLGTGFAANRGTMGPLGTTSVVVAPAGGGVPNDHVIDLDLVAIGASFSYDPSTGADLLVDVTFPAPVVVAALVPFSAGSATAVTARARMCSAAGASSTSGTLGAPPALLVDFVGAGGYAAATPARIERFGYGCSGPLRSFYQDWQLSETFDLANTSLTMSPISVAFPIGYTVTGGTTPPDLTKLNATPNSIADAALVAHPLGFTLHYPGGGSTTAIGACTDGYVWIDPTMTAIDSTPAVAELLGITVAQGARVAPFWYNFHAGRNAVSFPNSGLHVLTDTSGGPGNAVCYVTWYKVGRNDVATDGASVSDMQVVLYEATGVIEMRWGAMQVGAHALGVTGYSPGRVGTVPSLHPGPRDLSHEVPFFTQPDGSAHALTLGTNGQVRPIVGTSIVFQSYNQPVGTAFGMLCLDLQALQPSLQLPGLLASGCGFSLVPGSFLVSELVAAPTGTWSAAPLAIPANWFGFTFYAQYAALDPALTNISTSNGLKLTVGLN